jgi:hypothetical protein
MRPAPSQGQPTEKTKKRKKTAFGRGSRRTCPPPTSWLTPRSGSAALLCDGKMPPNAESHESPPVQHQPEHDDDLERLDAKVVTDLVLHWASGSCCVDAEDSWSGLGSGLVHAPATPTDGEDASPLHRPQSRRVLKAPP